MSECGETITVSLIGVEPIEIKCQGMEHAKRINGIKGDESHRAVVILRDKRVLYIFWEVS